MASDRTSVEDLLKNHGVVVADGGMGTLLFQRGLEVGGCPELLNVDQPDVVAGIHREYVAAGADIILTNTFGGTEARLGHFGLASRVVELNAAGVEISRSVAAAADRPVIVAGSIGPTGELPSPLGPLDSDRALALFTKQATALADAGANVLWIETMSSLEEMDAAFLAASSTGLSTVATMSFDTHGNTMMGVTPNDLAAWAARQTERPFAIGANCGIGPKDVVAAVRTMASLDTGIVCVTKANCGLPVFVNGQLEYPLRPVEMTAYAADAIASGALIVGACCGSIPDHIAVIRALVDETAG